MAQAPRTAYHTDGFIYNHDLNPALQPDSNYLSLPILGNTSVSLGSTMQMKDLFFYLPGNYEHLTLFTTNGTISKSDLLNRVGSGMKSSSDARLTLLSIGKRLNNKHYQTIEASFRTQTSAYIPRAFFSMVKDVENGSYDIDGLSVNASAFFEASYGESVRLDDKWTVGGKAKILVGITNVNANVNNLNVNLDAQGNWTAQGDIRTEMSGFEYKSKTEKYSSRRNTDGTPMTYEMVNGVKKGEIGLNGLGIAIDAGAEYKMNEHWTFSASLRDLGFICWFKGNKAANSCERFEFAGFQNVSKEGDNTLKNQWNVLKDDMIDMIHLEDKGFGNYTKMLNYTAEASAKYKYSIFTAGLLLTSCVQSKATWLESRLNLGFVPYKDIDIVVSPTYGTYGFSVGGMINYHHNGYHVYIASDRLFYEVNRQYIPTSLNAAIQFGMALPL